MNDIEAARERRAVGKKKWRGVTNELVVTYANPDCKACEGRGYIGHVEAGTVCGEDEMCAEQLFAAAYNGRIRWNKSRGRLEVFV